MIPPLYEHQKTTIADDKKRCGLFTGTGTAKTRTALEMAKGKILVICPKQQREDMTWQKNATKFGLVRNIKVISKEDLRKIYHVLPPYDTVIIDECHSNFGIAPEMRQRKGIQVPKTSQIFEATYAYLKKCPPKRLYLCSATPVPKPMAMWGIATILGQSWNFYEFRAKYYIDIRVGQRRVWIPKKDEKSKQALADLVKAFGYTGSLNDFFDVPEQTHKEVYIDLTEPQKRAMKELSHNEADPLVRRARERTIENGVLYGKNAVKINALEEQLIDRTILYPSGKIDYIVERALEFPKLLIFANYTAQINAIADKLREEGYTVLTLTGATKDRKTLIETAENSEACIVIAQSSVSSGWELPSFPCVVFASKSWRFVDYEQGIGRVLRANHLKKNLYIHLIVKGGPDEDCHKAIMSGVDFQEKLSINQNNEGD
jgi:hypothetical protein